jgi:hypothetical protein
MELEMQILKVVAVASLFALTAIISTAEAQQKKGPAPSPGAGPQCNYGVCVQRCMASSVNQRGCGNFCEKRMRDQRTAGVCK